MSVVACGRDPVAERATIAQGIYGETNAYPEFGYLPATPDPISMELTITRRLNNTLYAVVTSGEDGFFQRGLDTGSYRLCTSAQICTFIDVAAGARIRVDYTLGGPGLPRCDLDGRTPWQCEGFTMP